MKYSIWQIDTSNVKSADDKRRYAKFASLDEVVKLNGSTVDLELYSNVWQGDSSEIFETPDFADEAEARELLMKLWEKFNIGQRPAGYMGHSMSVSDIVEIDGWLYYCDSYGWAGLAEEEDINVVGNLTTRGGVKIEHVRVA